MEYKAHVSEKKKKVVEDVSKLIKEYPIIGAVNMEGLPTSSVQKMRAILRDMNVVLRMTKRRLMKIAIEKCKSDKKDIEEIESYLRGMPALLFTKENPFKLFNVLKKKKSSAPAKAGQTAPNDIVVPAGGTSFAPGPIIGELGAIGIKTKVDGGKLVITEDAVVKKEGEEIDAKTAELLSRLGIEPMEIGLDLVAVYENGTIFDKKILNIDEDEFKANMENAARWAFNLSVDIGHFTKENIPCVLDKAIKGARNLSINEGIVTEDTKEDILAKAEREMLGLKNEANIEIQEKPKEEKKNDDKEVKEEAKEEPKAAEEEKKAESSEEEKKAESSEEEKKAESSEEEKKAESSEEEKPATKEEKAEEEPKKEEKQDKEEIKDDSSNDHVDTEENEKEIKEEDKEELKKDIEEKEEKIDKEIKEVEKDIETEEKKESIDNSKAAEIEKKEEKIEKEIKEVEAEKKELDDQGSKAAETTQNSGQSKEDFKKSESLFEELKKKGTLRGADPDKKTVDPTSSRPEPEEIIAGIEKKKEAEKVPSAYDLMQEKNKNKKI